MEINYIGMYGKGKVQVIQRKGGIFCQSYRTVVCGIVRGKLKRYWGGYSKTTMAHVGQFVTDYNINVIRMGKGNVVEWRGVKTWDAMKVESCPIRIAG